MKLLIWFKKHWILSLFIFVILPITAVQIIIPARLNYSGYCWEQNRWLSDEEFLLAIAEKAEVGKVLQDIKKEKGNISKEDIKNFLKENPECCIFTRGYTEKIDGEIIGFISRISGFNYASAQVEYKRTDEDRKMNGWDEDYYQESLSVDACAKITFTSGWAINKDEYGRAYLRNYKLNLPKENY